MRRARGVTLLEALVTLAVTAVVLAALSRAVAGVARTREHAAAEADRLAAARTVLLRLAAEVEAALPGGGLAVEDADDPAAGSRLLLRTVVRAGPGGRPAADRRAVAYVVDRRAAALLRRERGAPEPADAPAAPPLAVLVGVRSLTVRSAGADGWRARWPAGPLPRAVELRLSLDDGAGGADELSTTVAVALGDSP